MFLIGYDTKAGEREVFQPPSPVNLSQVAAWWRTVWIQTWGGYLPATRSLHYQWCIYHW